MSFFVMMQQPPKATRTDTLLPYATVVRSVERWGASQRSGVEQLHPDLEAAQDAFEAIQGHGLSDLHGNVAESYPIEQHGARHCPPRRIPRHPKENFQCPGFPSSIPPRPPRSAR